MVTIILVVVVVIIILKLFQTMGKAAPFVFGYGVIYWLHNYIGEIGAWVLAGIFTLGVLKMLWDDANRPKNKEEWM